MSPTVRKEDFEEEPEGLEEDEGQEDEGQDEAVQTDAQVQRLEGEGVPAELQGKTPEEIARMYSSLKSTTEQMVSYMRDAGQGQAQVSPEPPQDEPVFSQEDLLETDPQKFEEKIETLFQKKAMPYLQDVYQNASVSALGWAESNLPHFEKYRDEIVGLAQRLPVNQTAQPQTWKLLHDHIVAQHVDDIVQERTQQQAKQQRTQQQHFETGRGAGEEQSKTVKLSKEERAIARGLGVSNKEFKAMKAKMGGKDA